MDPDAAAADELRALREAVSRTAHDLNNLLTQILVSSDLLLETLRHAPTGHEDAMVIRQAVLRAAHLTRQLLAAASESV